MCSQVLSATANDQDPGDLDSRLKKKKQNQTKTDEFSPHTYAHNQPTFFWTPDSEKPKRTKGQRREGFEQGYGIVLPPFLCLQEQSMDSQRQVALH